MMSPGMSYRLSCLSNVKVRAARGSWQMLFKCRTLLPHSIKRDPTASLREELCDFLTDESECVIKHTIISGSLFLFQDEIIELPPEPRSEAQAYAINI